jgi:hypothetical protein
MKIGLIRAAFLSVIVVAPGCGSPDAVPSSLVERAPESTSVQLAADPLLIEIDAAASSPLAGVVSVEIEPLGDTAQPVFSHELRYDYAEGRVTSDGHGQQLARESVVALGQASERLARELGTDDPTLPLHEQMAFAALVLLADSGGMPLWPQTFALRDGDTPGTVADKSLENDGVTCLQRGSSYPVSFDFASTTVVDTPITADSRSCNGLCGPSCTRLTPYAMWTLDCLEHDSCCSAIGDGTTCWTPLGECGDEYGHAETDFLRGFDPFRSHCGG